MNTNDKIDSVQGSSSDMPGVPDADEVKARQGQAAHEERARGIEAAMREPPLIEHKEQLRQRVEARMAEMAAALPGLRGGDAAHQRRARDIEAAMQAAQGSTSGGWDRVGEMEAAQLSHWLETTTDLLRPPQET